VHLDEGKKSGQQPIHQLIIETIPVGMANEYFQAEEHNPAAAET
jgi:hypothetical protein